MKKNGNRKNRKDYRKRRLIRKGVSAVLLVFMVLAFVWIRLRESRVSFPAVGPEQKKEQEAEADPTGEASTEPGGEMPDEVPDTGSADIFTLEMVPPYSVQAYEDINDDVPFFAEEEMTTEAFHQYWPLDELGRCTGAYACVGPETLPKQERGEIWEIRPTGWNTNRYSDIDGEMLFNRCHLIGHLLTGQDAGT